MLRHFVGIALLAVAFPAAAQLAPPPLPASLPPMSATDAAVARFYAARGNAPLWFEAGGLSPAARKLLDRLRTADLDSLADGPLLAARIDSSLAAPNADPMAIDRLLSTALVKLVAALHGASPDAHYVVASAKPPPVIADRTLALAAAAPDRAAHVAKALRKSRLYEDLRVALFAEMAANGGRADPRLIANLDRARLLPSSGRYVIVNPATARLMMVVDGEIVDSMNVVVGTRQTPTAPMVSMISFLTLNPYWNVAEDLVRKIVAPRVVRQGPAYLKRARYEAIDQYGPEAAVIAPDSIDWKAVVAGTRAVKLRQLPGPYNSMGQVKFPFPNELGLFLHDTPNKPQFAKSERATSNGCIRLEDAARLARWLYGSDPLATGSVPDDNLRLPAQVPLYITYLTAQPTGSGVQWARDVYALDQPVLASVGG